MNAMNTSNNEYELQPFDVLCGRDKKCYNNIGNRRFRILINSNLPRYLRCSNRKERSLMIFALTEELCCCTTTCSSIRFFKKQKNKEGLIQLDFKGCREKIGHALRDAASQHNKHNNNSRNTATAKSNNAIQEEQPQQQIDGKESSMNDMLPLSLKHLIDRNSLLLENMSATFSTTMSYENSSGSNDSLVKNNSNINNNKGLNNHRCSH